MSLQKNYMEQEIQLNGHNKQEYPPMHTAEHILNQTMIRMFGCERSKNTHIERKKSKCDYILSVEPTAEMVTEIENRVNEVIGQDLPVTTCFVTREEVPEGVDLSKLPEDASATLRVGSMVASAWMKFIAASRGSEAIFP